ncbi:MULTISPECIES: glutaredoxin domain-containing protein [unclassified Gemella]|uniref:glutaredoxin domain-containing protein n=1 Tax=unclassified Gemella TaxID=2624949 RepID=UPI0015D06638|nr:MULTISPECIES: glutaredoxin domain-containing protein [unclassified Gemella]MBF0710339.1 hypothetical protein [Gemella sp. GL1.1]NYS27683.1 hypothetical protein [Gemella sp. GL1]
MTSVKIYSTDPCANCQATKEMMQFHDIEFEELATHKLPATEQEEVLNMLREKGFTQFPVININDWEDSWSGFHPDKVEKYSEKY